MVLAFAHHPIVYDDIYRDAISQALVSVLLWVDFDVDPHYHPVKSLVIIPIKQKQNL